MANHDERSNAYVSDRARKPESLQWDFGRPSVGASGSVGRPATATATAVRRACQKFWDRLLVMGNFNCFDVLAHAQVR
jgi:hypothetical protein